MHNTLEQIAKKIHLQQQKYLKEQRIRLRILGRSTQVFIMAHGLGSRWVDENGKNLCPTVYKQLLPIGETPIIVRTLNQLGKLNVTNITVFAPHEFRYIIPKEIEILSIPMRSIDSLLTGILFTQFLWFEESNLSFLLGDDVFEYEIIKKILFSDLKRATLFGREGKNPITGKLNQEFYALHIPRIVRDAFVNELFQYAFDPKYFKLFHLPRVLKDLDVVYWNGWTGDIDSYDEYIKYYEKLEVAALEEDHANFG